MSAVTTGTTSITLHSCEGCRGYAEQPCKGSEDGRHAWECFDHWGHPTGEQMCHNALGVTVDEMCGALRHHLDQGHQDDHMAGHRAYLADGGECWCREAKP